MAHALRHKYFEVPKLTSHHAGQYDLKDDTVRKNGRLSFYHEKRLNDTNINYLITIAESCSGYGSFCP